MLFAIFIFLESYNCTTATPVLLMINNVYQQYVYVCLYGNWIYLLLQWWLQVLTCIIILDYWPQWQFEEGG